MTPTALTGRALWDAFPRNYDVAVQDAEAFAFAMLDALGTHGFAPLTGELVGGEPRKRYDARRTALYAYLDSQEVDPELRRLIDAMEDEVYDFASQTFDEGMSFALAAERFRIGLLGMIDGKDGQRQ